MNPVFLTLVLSLCLIYISICFLTCSCLKILRLFARSIIESRSDLFGKQTTRADIFAWQMPCFYCIVKGVFSVGPICSLDIFVHSVMFSFAHIISEVSLWQLFCTLVLMKGSSCWHVHFKNDVPLGEAGVCVPTWHWVSLLIFLKLTITLCSPFFFSFKLKIWETVTWVFVNGLCSVLYMQCEWCVDKPSFVLASFLLF